jgi:hypothetical protein
VIEEQAAEFVTDAARDALEPQPKAGGLRERRIEWVTWGLSVMILGISIIFGGNKPLSRDNDGLWLAFPLGAGGLMLISAVLQKILKNWNVSVITWFFGVLLLAAGIERFVAIWIIQDRQFFSFTYFLGSLVILAGLIILLQIFRRA